MNIICLMTSWPKRIKYVHLAILKLLSNTVVPTKIIITLSIEEFPNKENDLPKDLLELMSTNKVDIYWTDKNTKTIKKIFPVIDTLNDEDIIINCDDDINYPNDLIESRLNDFKNTNYENPITPLHNSYHRYIKTFACAGIYKKKMLNGWQKFINDAVIKTYEDDHVVAYIFALNGYIPKNCSKYKCTDWTFITNESSAGNAGIYNTNNTNKILDKRVIELYNAPILTVITKLNNTYKKLVDL